MARRVVLFKVFSASGRSAESDLEKRLNEWSSSLSESTVIKRTQLTHGEFYRGPDQGRVPCLVALVNYVVEPDKLKVPT